MFAVDPTDPTPLYAQLDRGIRAAVAAGKLRAGDRLPTVRQLAAELGVNANTVARVYAGLERAGVLSTRRGNGTFVREKSAPPLTLRDRELRPLVDRMLADSAALGISLDEVVAFIGELAVRHAHETR